MFCICNSEKNASSISHAVRNPFASLTSNTITNKKDSPTETDVDLELGDLLTAWGVYDRLGVGYNNNNNNNNNNGISSSSSCHCVRHDAFREIRFLPVELICNIMCFLELPALLQLRAVCRSFNEVFFTENVQLALAASVTQRLDETYLNAGVLIEIIRQRMAVLVRCEEAWSDWITRYVGAKLSSEMDVYELRVLLHKGETLCQELQRVRYKLRSILSLWLCFLASSRRIRYNIRHQLFNISSFGNLVSIGIRPLLLPDGTICVNGPLDTISFYSRCHPISGKKGVVWQPFAERRITSRVFRMFFNLYSNIIHIALQNGIVLKWRVNSPMGEKLVRDMQLYENDKEKKNKAPEVKMFHSYRIATSFLASFLPTSMDFILLPECPWKRKDILAITRAHRNAKAKSNNNDNNNEDDNNIEEDSTVIVVRRNKDVTNTLFANINTKDVRLTKKDLTEITALQHEMYAIDVKTSNHNNNNNNNNNNNSNNATSTFHTSESPEFLSHSEDDPIPSRFGMRCERVGGIVMQGAPSSTPQAREETDISNTINMHNSNETTTRVPILKTENDIVDRYVFALYNERTSLMCASATTGEVAHSLTNALFQTTIGVSRAGEVRSVRFLSSPVFKPSNASGQHREEGDVLSISLMPSRIFINKQTLVREIRIHGKCVMDNTCMQDNCKNKKSMMNLGCQSCVECEKKLKRRTWYFIKGYSYKASSIDISIIMEISLSSITSVLTPRPCLSQRAEVLLKYKKHYGGAINRQSRLYQRIHRWWSPLKDGHPYFRVPFIFFLSKFTPHITYLNPNSSTSNEHNGLSPSPSLPLDNEEDHREFKTIGIFDSFEQPFHNCKVMAISPSHAFFVLAVEHGALMLLSPSCTFNANNTQTNNNTVLQEEEKKEEREKEKEKEKEEEEKEVLPPVMTEINQCHFTDLETDTSVNTRNTLTDLSLNDSNNKNKNNSSSNSDNGSTQDSDEEGDAGEDERIKQQRQQQREPLSRFYRTTPFLGKDWQKQERERRQNAVRSLSSIDIFGDGFLEDSYIQTLQRGSESVLTSYRGGAASNYDFQFHGVWIRPPKESSSQSSLSVPWSLHLDGWKLTTLSDSFEVVVYDLTLRRNSEDDGFVFVALLAFSPYACQPFNDKVGLGLFLRQRIQHFIELETTNASDGSEIKWQNGILLICSVKGGVRYAVYDFDASFYDPNNNNNNNNNNNSDNNNNNNNNNNKNNKSGSLLPLSVSLRKKCRLLPASTMGMPTLYNGNIDCEENSLYLYPLPNHSMLHLLFSYILRPVVLFLLFIAFLFCALRIDEYVSVPFWALFILYFPFPVNTIISDLLPYDRYFQEGSGFPFISSIIVDVLMFLLFPLLYVLRRDAYTLFHPMWKFICIPLEIAILLIPLPSFYKVFCMTRGVRMLCSLSRILYLLQHLLCIAFVVLLSIFFDGPSADDPQKPKFSLFLAFLPLLAIFVIAIAKVIYDHYRSPNGIAMAMRFCLLFLWSAPALLFALNFFDYYAAIYPGSLMARPSLVQSIFIILLGLLIVFCYYALLSFSFFFFL